MGNISNLCIHTLNPKPYSEMNCCTCLVESSQNAVNKESVLSATTQSITTLSFSSASTRNFLGEDEKADALSDLKIRGAAAYTNVHVKHQCNPVPAGSLSSSWQFHCFTGARFHSLWLMVASEARYASPQLNAHSAAQATAVESTRWHSQTPSRTTSSYTRSNALRRIHPKASWGRGLQPLVASFSMNSLIAPEDALQVCRFSQRSSATVVVSGHLLQIHQKHPPLHLPSK